MTTPRLLYPLLLSLALTACGTTLTREETQPWLEKRAGTAEYNVSGTWESNSSPSGDWGTANFIQDGARVYGQMGSYNVDGALSGNSLYLALSSGYKVYYTGQLKRQVDGSYAGRMAENAIIGSDEADREGFQLLILRRPVAVPTQPPLR